jgi:hypothetical protein
MNSTSFCRGKVFQSLCQFLFRPNDASCGSSKSFCCTTIPVGVSCCSRCRLLLHLFFSTFLSRFECSVLLFAMTRHTVWRFQTPRALPGFASSRYYFSFQTRAMLFQFPTQQQQQQQQQPLDNGVKAMKGVEVA